MKKEISIDYSKLTKLYYSISEVAQLFDVNASLIRFWEKELALEQPKKNKKEIVYLRFEKYKPFKKFITLSRFKDLN